MFVSHILKTLFKKKRLKSKKKFRFFFRVTDFDSILLDAEIKPKLHHKLSEKEA